ncbi:lytic transglycosylase domain-containing protein [Photorhabdus noenieputensis]|uniref:lytic transglycosylase domain-containing protein n=1 Tax=Photorhabdus noenieputensis TaxID=1208607 RepID=UPI001BD1CAC8|nr:lytic transglycosylase domain-containing protein [Photorhabdus noenieputensis]MCK3667521.1 lytic transglycosylase domain-containing protein [Photorhabdus noenieputensis]
MANIIDELVITLGLDAAEFSAGETAVIAGIGGLAQVMQKLVDSFNDGEKKTSKSLDKTGKKTEKVAKEMEAAGKKASSFFSSIKSQILALAGVTVSLGGLKSFVTSFAGNLNQLSTAADAFGMSAKALDGWTKAGQAFGVSANEIVGAFSRINDAKARLKSGVALDPALETLLKTASQAGVDIDIASESTESIMRKLSGVFPRLNKDQQQAYGGELGFGYAAQQWFSSGHALKDVDKFTASSGVDDKSVAAARRFREQWTEISQSFEKTGYILFNALLPYINDFNIWLKNLADWMNKHPEEIKKAVSGFLDKMSFIISVANQAADAVGGWGNVIIGLIGLKFAGWLWGIYRVASSILKMGKGSGGLSGKGAIGKAGIYGAIGYALYDPVESVATSIIGQETKNILDSYGLYLASDWTPFFSKKEYEAYQAKLDGKASKPDTAVIKEEEKRSENDRIIRVEDERQQRLEYSNNWLKAALDKLTDSINKLIDSLVPQVSASEVSPNTTGMKLLGWLSPKLAQLEQQFGLPEGLLRSVAMMESGGNQYAVSKAGAKGLFQFMPGTAKHFGLMDDDVFDPVKSSEAAAKYLFQLMRMFDGDLSKALAAYNWGQGNVIRKGLGAAPKETRDYIPKVLANMPQLGAHVAAQRYSNTVNNNRTSSVSESYHIGTIQVSSNANNVKGVVNDARQKIGGSTLATSYSTGVTG